MLRVKGLDRFGGGSQAPGPVGGLLLQTPHRSHALGCPFRVQGKLLSLLMDVLVPFLFIFFLLLPLKSKGTSLLSQRFRPSNPTLSSSLGSGVLCSVAQASATPPLLCFPGRFESAPPPPPPPAGLTDFPVSVRLGCGRLQRGVCP